MRGVGMNGYRKFGVGRYPAALTATPVMAVGRYTLCGHGSPPAGTSIRRRGRRGERRSRAAALDGRYSCLASGYSEIQSVSRSFLNTEKYRAKIQSQNTGVVTRVFTHNLPVAQSCRRHGHCRRTAHGHAPSLWHSSRPYACKRTPR